MLRSQCVDQIHPRRYSGIFRIHDDRFTTLRDHCTTAQFLLGFYGYRTSIVGGCGLLLCPALVPHRLPFA